MLLTNRLSRVFYGWWIVIACGLVSMYVGGVYFSGFTALVDPVVQEFGWSYALVSLVATFRGFESGFLSPFVGFFTDKFGSKRLLIIGLIIMGLGFLLLGKISNLIGFYGAYLFLALGASLVSPVVTMSVVARWFKTRTSLAMGFLVAGFAAGGLLVPVVVWLVDQLDWKAAVVIFGVGMWLIGIPLTLLVRDHYEEAEIPKDKRTPTGHSSTPGDFTVRQVLKTKAFWLLSTAILLGWVAGSAIMTHQIPYMVSLNIPRQTAGYLAMVLAFSSIIGRLVLGWLGDLFDKRWIFAFAILSKGVGVLIFALATSVGQLIPALIALGFGLGGVVPLRATLQMELFGMKAFGTIQGLLMIFSILGGMASAPFAGWVFDTQGSYRVAFLILGAITLFAIPVILATGQKSTASLRVTAQR